MALIKCKECGKDVSTGAKSCPNCGTHSFGRSKLIPLLAILVGVYMLSNIFSSNDNAAPEHEVQSETGQPAKTELAQNPKYEKAHESCAQIGRKLGEESKLSEIQKEALWEKKYLNKTFKWRVQLADAESTFLGDIEASFICLPPVANPTKVTIVYPKELKQRAMRFRKGTPYVVTGVLKQFELYDTVSGTRIVEMRAEPTEESQESGLATVSEKSKKNE